MSSTDPAPGFSGCLRKSGIRSRSTAIPTDPAAAVGAAAVEYHPLPRQAFLLLSLEGFSEEEVAYILATDVAETRRLADAAGREMAAEIATDVLIIEDETFIAMDLESLVKSLGHNVIGVARTHSDAVALARNKNRA